MQVQLVYFVFLRLGSSLVDLCFLCLVTRYFILHSCNVANDDRFLPGSCLLVPELLLPQHPPLCVDIEQSCLLFH